jgi:hypothetical protein
MISVAENGTARLKKCKQLFKYQHLLLLRDIWWSKFKSTFKCSSFFQHQSSLEICGSLRQLFSCIGVYYVLFHCEMLRQKAISSLCHFPCYESLLIVETNMITITTSLSGQVTKQVRSLGEVVLDGAFNGRGLAKRDRLVS